jgi:hypothetical protein
MTTLPTAPTARRLRCALFVDFDNVYLGLMRLDAKAADAFATDPGRWLAELASGTDDGGEFTRRFLVRACYLNPSAFAQYRANFTRAGFQVVDCPSLTQQGKSSADINLVLDAVDALAADTHYDEFVIVSADADFTPLALRCRAADRRVTIVTASPAESAYRSVADEVLGADAFAALVLPAGRHEGEPVAVEPAKAGPSAAPAGPAESRATGPASDDDAARRAVLRRVRSADAPILLGTAAQVAISADASLPAGRWAGTGSFRSWLAATLPELGTSTVAPGYVWDPGRFDEADLPGAEPPTVQAAAGPVQRQVVAVTDVPGLTADDYRTLLASLADDVAAHPFERSETIRRVRDACQARGAKVGRASVGFVVDGLLLTGADLAARPAPKAPRLAAAWADNVVGLARGARVELTAKDEATLRTWVSGGLAKD